jgi:hypothetical protein
MQFSIRLDAAALRRWHIQLLERLAADGIDPGVEFAPAQSGNRKPDLRPLFAIERRIHGLRLADPLEPVPVEAFSVWLRPRGEGPLLDLAAETGGAGRCWRLRIDGIDAEAGLLAAACSGQAPVAEISEDTTLLASARLGTERGDIAQAAFAEFVVRVATLIAATLRGGRSAAPPMPASEADRSGAARSVAWLTARSFARGLATHVYRRLFHTPHWRVGWRKLAGPDLFDLGAHPDTGWRDLPDDGARFYADPFPIEHEGVVTLFVEELCHAEGKGVISAVRFGPDGPVGAPARVLELDTHLSYPHVFVRDGEIWMIPENCQAGRIDLYRATAFPGGWVRDRTLVDGVVASDATIIEHGGLWWMFATVRDGGGAFSDALWLWSAPDFRGPWTAHPRNPVLIDIASARPAGRMVHRNGALLRPVQDCRRGYGRALAIARVTRLDREGFAQEVVSLIEAGQPAWPGRRIHSLNSAGGYEFIDGSAQVRRALLSHRPAP